MRILFPVVASLVLWACHEQKPRPITDCGDSCIDAGEVEPDAGDDELDAGEDG